MAEDFQIQQGVNSQTTSPVYGLTGTVLGAGGTYYGLNKLTKPKYGSYEELINEAKDSFDKKVEKAAEGDKAFFTNVEEIRDIIASSNKKFDDRKAELLKSNEKLSENELEELVCKEFNVKNKAEYVNNSIKEKADTLFKDFGEKIKYKWGFEGNTKWKLAGAAVAGALVLGGLFNALAPKKQA